MRGFFKNIIEAFEELGKDVQKIGNYLYSVLFGELFDIWKMIVLIAITLIVEYIICYDMFHSWAYYGQKFGYYWIVKNIIIVPIILYLTVMMKRLRVGIEEIVDGNTNYKVDTAGMYGNLREWAENLNNISDGMNAAIEQRLKSERMKTELITNVSHDLKTPLTSMIGYTDLLKKEELSAEAKDYVEIISLKQEKLKDMIQNLFELSKATSGVDLLTIETLDMRKLLEQTLGDMEDAIRESGREIRTKFPEEPLLFKGDNEKMYRVVQNLLENALKYSMEGTRIYLDIRRESNRIYTEIKNIASYEMDFAPEEIMERFVRGDESRSTEGHGLGFAIASSFVRNMDGMMDIEIDGDLFKVILNFPVVQE